MQQQQQYNSNRAIMWRSPLLGIFLFFAAGILNCCSAAAVATEKQQHSEQQKQTVPSVTANAGARSLRSRSKQQQREQEGQRNLIIGGHTAAKDRYPYYVALLDAYEEIQCGGTLIAPDIVLTAAHCRGSDLKWALVGKYSNLEDDGHEKILIMNPLERINDFSSFSQVQSSGAATIDSAGFIHPDHDLQARTYDVMLMKLERTANSSHSPLMKVNTDPNMPAQRISGNEITVIGMGNTDVSGLDKPDVLQQVHLDYLSYEKCIDSQGYSLSYKYELLPHMICTMGEGLYTNRGQCYGDSGGPYIVLGDTPEEDVQVGVVSWAVNCASSVFPMVGSRTSESFVFIRDVTCAVSADPPADLCSGNNYVSADNDNTDIQTRIDIQNGVSVSVRIYTDPYGHELKWSLKDQSDWNKVYADIPYGTIVGDHSFHDVTVPAGSNLRFEIKDAADDGIYGDADAILYEVVLVDAQGREMVMVEGNGQFGTSRQNDFHVPLANEYATAFASRSSTNDATPVTDRDGFSSCTTVPTFIGIEFDDYHEDASWQVTSIDGATIYASKAPGVYRYGNEVKEQIDLCAGKYKFTISDRRGADEFRAFKKYKLSYRGLLRSDGEIPLYESQPPFIGESVSHEFEIPNLIGNELQPSIIIEDAQSEFLLGGETTPCKQSRGICSIADDCCSQVCLGSLCVGGGSNRGSSGSSSRNSMRYQGNGGGASRGYNRRVKL